ncbi:hypothetical protein BKA93DRAFT_752914 [Sparassis latifolia]
MCPVLLQLQWLSDTNWKLVIRGGNTTSPNATSNSSTTIRNCLKVPSANSHLPVIPHMTLYRTGQLHTNVRESIRRVAQTKVLADGGVIIQNVGSQTMRNDGRKVVHNPRYHPITTFYSASCRKVYFHLGQDRDITRKGQDDLHAGHLRLGLDHEDLRGDQIEGLDKDFNAKKSFCKGVFAKDDAGIHGWEIEFRMGDMPPSDSAEQLLSRSGQYREGRKSQNQFKYEGRGRGQGRTHHPRRPHADLIPLVLHLSGLQRKYNLITRHPGVLLVIIRAQKGLYVVIIYIHKVVAPGSSTPPSAICEETWLYVQLSICEETWLYAQLYAEWENEGPRAVVRRNELYVIDESADDYPDERNIECKQRKTGATIEGTNESDKFKMTSLDGKEGEVWKSTISEEVKPASCVHTIGYFEDGEGISGHGERELSGKGLLCEAPKELTEEGHDKSLLTMQTPEPKCDDVVAQLGEQGISIMDYQWERLKTGGSAGRARMRDGSPVNLR